MVLCIEHICIVLNCIPALAHQSAAPPPTKRRRVSKYSRPEEDHVTGCARSEGYYKIDMRDKKKYLPHHRLKDTTTTSTTQSPAQGKAKVGTVTKEPRYINDRNQCWGPGFSGRKPE